MNEFLQKFQFNLTSRKRKYFLDFMLAKPSQQAIESYLEYFTHFHPRFYSEWEDKWKKLLYKANPQFSIITDHFGRDRYKQDPYRFKFGMASLTVYCQNFKTLEDKEHVKLSLENMQLEFSPKMTLEDKNYFVRILAEVVPKDQKYYSFYKQYSLA